MAWIIVSVVFLALLWAVVVVLQLPWSIAVVGTVAVVLGWGAALAWRLLRARRASGQIEKALKAQAEAQASQTRPDQQADVEAMQAEFQKAVQALKGSKLARGGRDALALLPWYLIIGPPGSGKSTALRASGLKFPYLTQRGGVRGVGGTRNCEWWLTNEAVILDTAGRYSTEEEDHEEWTSFLDTLKKARPRKPVNGLVVAVSFADLGAETEEAAGILGQRLRERVDEVLSRLQVLLPVYVLFTKCDLLPGFTESFADLRKSERGQVWGITVPLGEGREVAEVFQEGFDELVTVLEERALVRMADERQVTARERIYGFPRQVEALRGHLSSFLQALFVENVYQDAPILRGIYFSSGTQEGRTIDRLMAAMAEAFGVRPQVQAPEPVVEAKSYFLRDVFAKVMFPDQDIAVRSAVAEKREALRRWIVVGASAALGLFALALPLRAFLLNRELVLSTGATVDAVALQLRQVRPGGQPPVDKLEPLRARLDELVSHAEAGAPWSMRLGMYQGGELLPHLRIFHAQGARRLILDPIYNQDLGDMGAFVQQWERTTAPPPTAEHARHYDLLKMHLLLTAPRGLAEPGIDEALATWIGGQVAARWQARWSLGTEPSATQHIASNARLFAKVLASDPGLALPRHEGLVQRMRRILERVPLSTLALERLAAEVDPKGLEVTLQTALGGPVPSLRSSETVRGAFTRRGFETIMKERLEDPGELLELWVLAADPRELETIQAREAQRLRSRYFGQYIEVWRRFAESIAPVGAGGSQATLALLQDLTRGAPPPYARVFRTVGYNTRIAGAAGSLEKLRAGVIEKVREKLSGPKGQALDALVQTDRDEAVYGPTDVEAAFAGFVGFGYAGDQAAGAEKSLPLDVYQEQIGFVRDALQTAVEGTDPGPLVGRVTAARTRVRSLIDTQPVGWRPTLERLLWPPIEWASASTAKEAAAGASQKWCSTVALPWRRNLASRYPFRRDGEDAALADLGEFFRPGSGLVWGFYGEALRNDIQRQGEGFAFTRQMGGATGFSPALLVFLQQAQEISTVLFPAGASEPRVPFTVRIRPTPKVASVLLEVDGQRFEYFNGPEEWRKMTWPSPGRSGGSLIRVRTATGQEETLQQDGEWGLFKLLELGRLRGEPSQRDFTMTFEFPGLGVSVVMEFRPDRSEAPFFGIRRGSRARLLAPFRSGISAPMTIGKGAPPCG